ncbi:unnamed protein product [Thelazia callipaeda]|uniref:MYND-type domain-containing protein n=1 Tax=Thelazia callipaeda TaxID=103827 RepID=A0A0N5D1I3_THECL|nr:unnamed protein product [Thelazia callipaeda]
MDETATLLLIEEQPLAHVVESQFTSQICAYCMEPIWERICEDKLKRCSGCKFSHYCGLNCQKKDWPIHKKECSYLSRVAPLVPGSIPRLIGRIITTLKQNGDKPSFNGRSFASLTTHAEDFKRDKKERSAFESIVHVIRHYFLPNQMPSKSELFDIFCKIVVNAFKITDSCLQEIGTGLYLGLSVLDHSCKPDAFVIFNGTKAALRSLRSNTEYSDKLRISYIDISFPKCERQKNLESHYRFTCDCEVCQNIDLDRQKFSLRCKNCRDGYCPYNQKYVHSRTKLPCKVCGAKSYYDLDEIQDISEKFKSDEWSKKSLDEQMDLYCSLEKILSPFNIYLRKLAENIVSAAVEEEKYDVAIKYKEKTLLSFITFFPENYPCLSVWMFSYAKLLNLEKSEKYFGVLRKAFQMICKSYGSESKFASVAAQVMSYVREPCPQHHS